MPQQAVLMRGHEKPSGQRSAQVYFTLPFPAALPERHDRRPRIAGAALRAVDGQRALSPLHGMIRGKQNSVGLHARNGRGPGTAAEKPERRRLKGRVAGYFFRRAGEDEGAVSGAMTSAWARLRFQARMAAPCETDHCCDVWPQAQTTRHTSCRRPGGNMDSRWTLAPPQTRQGRIVCGSSSFMIRTIAALPTLHKRGNAAVLRYRLTLC